MNTHKERISRHEPLHHNSLNSAKTAINTFLDAIFGNQSGNVNQDVAECCEECQTIDWAVESIAEQKSEDDEERPSEREGRGHPRGCHKDVQLTVIPCHCRHGGAAVGSETEAVLLLFSLLLSRGRARLGVC